MPSIWPADLAQDREVPAVNLGHTLILTTPDARRFREVLHTFPAKRLTTATHRLRSALRAAGHPAPDGGAGTNDTGLPCLWVGTGADGIVAVDTPECVGRLAVNMAPGYVSVVFKPETIKPGRGWFILANVHDPDIDPAAGRWSIPDRDRWLTWAGITPA